MRLVIGHKAPISSTSVSIASVQGQVLMNQNLSTETLATNTNISSLHPGNYLLLIVTNGKEKVLKFLKE